MRFSTVAACLLCAAPVWADDCAGTIAALYDDGGAMDPFSRVPHVQTVSRFDAEGALLGQNINYMESPLRTLAGVVDGGHFTLAIDLDYWTGPTLEGPWTSYGVQLPANREEAMRQSSRDEQSNVAEATCGTSDDGLLHYAYRTASNPDAAGNFFGTFYDLWIDPEAGHIVRMQMTDFVNPWTEGVSKERHEISFAYDPALTVPRP